MLINSLKQLETVGSWIVFSLDLLTTRKKKQYCQVYPLTSSDKLNVQSPFIVFFKMNVWIVFRFIIIEPIRLWTFGLRWIY